MQHFFVCEMYKKQIDGERFFLHEQPAQASLVSCGWWATNVRSGCRAPMWRDQALVRKPTGWMTNSMKVGKVLERRCPGGHRHCNIFSGGAHTMRITERYPVRLVNVVLKAQRQEVKKRYQLGTLEAGQHVDEPDVWLTSPEYYEEIYDAITGVRLDPALVAKARNTEMSFLVDELNAYKYDSVDNCLKTTGKRPIPVKWVDVNKGDAQHPEVRSRLAVAETSHTTRYPRRTMRRHSRQHYRTKLCGCLGPSSCHRVTQMRKATC